MFDLPVQDDGVKLRSMVGAIIYIRVSTKEQTENLSLPTQLRVCEEYCRREGFEILERFKEEGESAKTIDRRELQRMLAYCRSNKGKVHFLVVFNLTRFARRSKARSEPRPTTAHAYACSFVATFDLGLVGAMASARSLKSSEWAAGAMERTVFFAAEPTRQPSTTAANARWDLLVDLLEKVGRLTIVAIFSCPTEQTLDLLPVAHAAAIEEGDSKVILSFLAAVLGRAVGSYRPSICPHGRRGIPASSYPILKTVADFKPGIAIMRASRTSPPLKSSPEVAEFAVRSCDVVRCGRVSEAKLVPQPANRELLSVQITHDLGA